MPIQAIKGVTEAQFRQLLIECAGLPFIHPAQWACDYVLDVMQTVLDFQMLTTTVEKAMLYFRDQVQAKHGIHNHEQLVALLNRFPDSPAGNQAASELLWNNRHWTRIELLRRFLLFLEQRQLTDQPSLHAWAKQASFERDFKGQVKGLGIAVFHWLVIRCGADSIKPDVWVINFVKRVIGKRLPERTLIALFQQISPLLGESLQTLDVTIWYYEKLGMATKDCPGLRIAFWHALHQGLAEMLNGEHQPGRWQVVLDEKSKLRYDVAGLTLVPQFDLFGPKFPGESLVLLRQSSWHEGLLLSVQIELRTAISKKSLAPLKRKLALKFWLSDTASGLIAEFPLEESMVISPKTTADEVLAWANEIAGRVQTLLAMRKPERQAS